eukprot:g7692.t1
MLRNQTRAGLANKVDFDLFEELDPIDKRAVGPNLSEHDAVLDFLDNGDDYLESDSLGLMSERLKIKLHAGSPDCQQQFFFTNEASCIQLAISFIMLLSRSTWFLKSEKKERVRDSLKGVKQGEQVFELLEKLSHKPKRYFAGGLDETLNELHRLVLKYHNSQHPQPRWRFSFFPLGGREAPSLGSTTIQLLDGWSKAVVNEDFVNHVRRKWLKRFGGSFLPEEGLEFGQFARDAKAPQAVQFTPRAHPSASDYSVFLPNLRDLAFLYRAAKKLWGARTSRRGLSGEGGGKKKPVVFVVGAAHLEHLAKRLQALLNLKSAGANPNPPPVVVASLMDWRGRLTLKGLAKSALGREYGISGRPSQPGQNEALLELKHSMATNCREAVESGIARKQRLEGGQPQHHSEARFSAWKAFRSVIPNDDFFMPNEHYGEKDGHGITPVNPDALATVFVVLEKWSRMEGPRDEKVER